MKSPRNCYEFGPFRLDPSERQLTRVGEVVPLTPKVFDTLLLFVENSNLLLTKDEMIVRLWPDSFVEEGNLAQNVSMLRRALGDQPNGKPYIETVPKRGYRFIAEARLCSADRQGEIAFTPVGGDEAGEYERLVNKRFTEAPFEFDDSPPPAPSLTSPTATRPMATAAARRKRGATWAAIAMAAIAMAAIAVGGVYLLFRSISPSRSEAKLRVAVLPFRNLGPDAG